MLKKIGHIILCLTLVFLLTNILSFNNGDSNNIVFASGVTIEKGDLLFLEVRPIWAWLPYVETVPGNEGNDHVVIYAGNNEVWEACDYSKIPGRIDGVQNNSMKWIKFVYQIKKVGKINITTIQKQKAIDFCKDQAGELYQWTYDRSESLQANPDCNAYPRISRIIFRILYHDPYDPYIDEWYCSELVWAAYMHAAGINLFTESPGIEYIFGFGLFRAFVPAYDLLESKLIDFYDY